VNNKISLDHGHPRNSTVNSSR